MTNAERAAKHFAEMIYPFDLNTEDQSIRLEATTEQMAKLVVIIQLRPDMAKWSVEPVHPEFPGWTPAEIEQFLYD